MQSTSRPRRPFAVAWSRLKETPLEVTIAVLAAVAAVVEVVFEWPTLTVTTGLVDLVLFLGGVGVVAGRYLDDADVESAGLAFLLAAFGFLFLKQLPPSWHEPTLRLRIEAMIGLVFNFGALVVGYGVRLRVVRVAAKARRRVPVRGGRDCDGAQ